MSIYAGNRILRISGYSQSDNDIHSGSIHELDEAFIRKGIIKMMKKKTIKNWQIHIINCTNKANRKNSYTRNKIQKTVIGNYFVGVKKTV